MAGAKGKQVQFELVQVGGVDTRVWQGQGTATDAKGVVFTRRGEVAKARGIQSIFSSWDGGNPFGSTAILSLATLNRGGLIEIAAAFSDKVKVMNGDALAQMVPTQSGLFTTGRPRDAMRMFQSADVLIMLNGYDRPQKWDGRKVTPLGITAVPPSPSEPVGWCEGGGTALRVWTNLSLQGITHKIAYRMTLLNDKGQESEPGPSSPTLDFSGFKGTGSAITATDYYLVFVSGLASDPPSLDIVARNLYRTTDGGLTWSLLRRLDGTSTDTLWDGTPVGSEGSDLMYAVGTNLAPPVARGGFVFRGRTYYWGVADTPALLYYSNTNAKESVAAGNFLDVDSSDGEPITGGMQVQDFAVVWKRRSMYLLTHDKTETPILTPVARGIGAVSDRAITTIDGRVVFLGDEGLYVYDGARVKALSDDVSELVRQLPRAYIEDSLAWSDDVEGRAYISVVAGPGTTPNEVWCIHLASGAFTRIPGMTVYSAVRVKNQTFVGFSYVSGGATVYDIGVFGTGWSIGGTGYDGTFETRWLDFKNPESDKRAIRLDLVYVGTMSGSLTVKWFKDWDKRTVVGSATIPLADDSATVWNSGLWSSTARMWDGARTCTKRIDLPPTTDVFTSGKCFMFRLETTGADTPFLLVGGTIFYVDLGIREEGTDL